MVKVLKSFFSMARKDFNLTTKFRMAFNAGSRILPSRSKKNDAKYQFRIDAGELIADRFRNLVLQINSEATSTVLKEYLKKHGTHAKLATVAYDTLAEDEEAELERVMDEMETQAKAKL